MALVKLRFWDPKPNSQGGRVMEFSHTSLGIRSEEQEAHKKKEDETL